MTKRDVRKCWLVPKKIISETKKIQDLRMFFNFEDAMAYADYRKRNRDIYQVRITTVDHIKRDKETGEYQT